MTSLIGENWRAYCNNLIDFYANSWVKATGIIGAIGGLAAALAFVVGWKLAGSRGAGAAAAFFALFAGAIWAYNAWGTFWSWDPKEVGSWIIWLFYTGYLHARYKRGWQGRRAAILAIIGFAMVILSFIGNLFLGGQHAYEDLG